jgi:hypothetical protein
VVDDAYVADAFWPRWANRFRQELRDRAFYLHAILGLIRA